MVLLDLYSGAPQAAAVVAARGLMVMAGVVADSELFTRHGATMALTALRSEMSAAQMVQRVTSALDAAARRAASYAHYRRLFEDEADHDKQVARLHDRD